jgi:hypothetical protein
MIKEPTKKNLNLQRAIPHFIYSLHMFIPTSNSSAAHLKLLPNWQLIPHQKGQTRYSDHALNVQCMELCLHSSIRSHCYFLNLTDSFIFYLYDFNRQPGHLSHWSVCPCVGWPAFDSRQRKELFFSPLSPVRLWDPPCLPSNGYTELISRGYGEWSMKLTSIIRFYDSLTQNLHCSRDQWGLHPDIVALFLFTDLAGSALSRHKHVSCFALSLSLSLR